MDTDVIRLLFLISKWYGTVALIWIISPWQLTYLHWEEHKTKKTEWIRTQADIRTYICRTTEAASNRFSYFESKDRFWGGRHCTEVAFALHTQPDQVQISVPEFFQRKMSDVAVLINSKRAGQKKPNKLVEPIQN